MQDDSVTAEEVEAKKSSADATTVDPTPVASSPVTPATPIKIADLESLRGAEGLGTHISQRFSDPEILGASFLISQSGTGAPEMADDGSPTQVYFVYIYIFCAPL